MSKSVYIQQIIMMSDILQHLAVLWLFWWSSSLTGALLSIELTKIARIPQEVTFNDLQRGENII